MSRLDERLQAVDRVRVAVPIVGETSALRLELARRSHPVPRTIFIGVAVVAVLVVMSMAGRARVDPPATALPVNVTAAAPAPSAADRLAEARAAAALGARDRARPLLEQAVVLAPNDADAWNDLGVMRVLDGDLAGGIKAFWRALDVNPRHADARRNLATALEREAKAEGTK